MGDNTGISMNKKINEYKALVFDLDGTLYYQRQLRLKMAWMLGNYYLCHFWCIKELFIIKKFREVREKWDEITGVPTGKEPAGKKILTAGKDSGANGDKNSETTHGEKQHTGNKTVENSLEWEQYSYVAGRMGCTADRVKTVIETWMYEKPLKAVYETRDVALIELIKERKAAGQKIFIFSDYPIEDKLKAIGLTADGMYAATDERLSELKPSPKGLHLIMEDHGLNPSDILMIGDRMSRDGQSAINAGCDHVILPGSKSLRNKIYARNLKG
ncbi:MAG: HAD family hydrolase [Lachnospiraceae bacterium]|nr:HAD family hydrolase [Lachnospiraceae bacterium]